MGTSFATTQWSRVLAARDGSDSEAHEALAAQDLTQAYFAELLEKDILQGVEPSAGRFRSFLLASLKNFLSHKRDRDRAQKRGGGTPTISLDTQMAEERFGYEPTDRLTPEEIFERRWALTVLERALGQLRQASADSGNEAQFERLKGYLTGQESRTPYREVAAELGMTEVAVRGAVHRLRHRLGQLLRAEIAETVAKPEEIDNEIRHLLLVIRPWEEAES